MNGSIKQLINCDEDEKPFRDTCTAVFNQCRVGPGAKAGNSFQSLGSR
jgi:hypothetical protein